MSTSNVVKPLGDRGSAPDPAEEAYDAPHTTSWWAGGGCPSKEPHPAVLCSELWLYISKFLDSIMVA